MPPLLARGASWGLTGAAIVPMRALGANVAAKPSFAPIKLLPPLVKPTPATLLPKSGVSNPRSKLPAIIEFIIVNVPLISRKIPPPLPEPLLSASAVLLVIVLLVIVPPFKPKIPPPSKVAVLPDTVLLVRVTAPKPTIAPPPSPVLPDTVLLVSVTSTPKIPPPASLVAVLPDTVLLVSVTDPSL